MWPRGRMRGANDFFSCGNIGSKLSKHKIVVSLTVDTGMEMHFVNCVFI